MSPKKTPLQTNRRRSSIIKDLLKPKRRNSSIDRSLHKVKDKLISVVGYHTIKERKAMLNLFGNKVVQEDTVTKAKDVNLMKATELKKKMEEMRNELVVKDGEIDTQEKRITDLETTQPLQS